MIPEDSGEFPTVMFNFAVVLSRLGKFDEAAKELSACNKYPTQLLPKVQQLTQYLNSSKSSKSTGTSSAAASASSAAPRREVVASASATSGGSEDSSQISVAKTEIADLLNLASTTGKTHLRGLRGQYFIPAV